MFLEKLKAQGWLAVFMNTNRGWSVPDLGKLYANCVVTNGVVTSIVNGRKLRFNAKELGAILGVPSEGFDVYVHEDKNMLGTERLVELTRRLSQKLDLLAPQFVKTGEMTSLHILIFWFIIKNVIPRGQASEQGPQTPFGPVLGETSTSRGPMLDTLLQDQNHLKEEISEVKQVLTEEKALNAKHRKDLLSAFLPSLPNLLLHPPKTVLNPCSKHY